VRLRSAHEHEPSQVVRQLRPLRSATIAINGARQTFPPALSDGHREILQALKNPGVTH